MKRRNFLHQSAAVVGAATILPSSVIFGKPFLPSEKVQIALIGCNNMGFSNLKGILKSGQVQCVALCDVDENVLATRSAELEKLENGGKADKMTDYRKVLARKDVDAVIIGTPDHWHALMTIEACMAGKDVYVEKPLACTVEECNAMVAAAQKYQRAVQVGQWQRSQQHFQDAIAYVRSGKLGDIFSAKTFIAGRQNKLEIVPDSAAPAGVDYEMWLGPAPKRAFNKNRFHGSFRWFWDYAGGLMTDWGVHLLDIPVFALGAGAPKSVLASGGKRVYPDDARQTPDTLTAIYEFDKFQLTWEHSMALGNQYINKHHGITFIGQNGSLLVNRSGWEVMPEGKTIEAVPHTKNSDDGVAKHTENWVNVIKSRKISDLKCSVEEGAKVAILSCLGNAAYRTGEPLAWDATKNRADEKKANRLLAANYSNGWKLPTV